jgi:hypothetical protein
MDKAVPLEVKSGEIGRSKSLTTFGAKYDYEILSRTTTRNLRRDGIIVNYPLYALHAFPLLY